MWIQISWRRKSLIRSLKKMVKARKPEKSRERRKFKAKLKPIPCTAFLPLLVIGGIAIQLNYTYTVLYGYNILQSVKTKKLHYIITSSFQRVILLNLRSSHNFSTRISSQVNASPQSESAHERCSTPPFLLVIRYFQRLYPTPQQSGTPHLVKFRLRRF